LDIQDLKTVKLEIVYEKGALVFRVRNHYFGNLKLDKGRIITKKKDAINHGIGFLEIERIVNKYNGTMDIKNENNIFTITTMLFL
jgi:sensor histidine kinase regulating citrate/malate metabolism